MSITKDKLVSNVILQLTRGKPSSDFELERTQVMFWIDVVLPSLVKQTLDIKLQSGDGCDATYVCISDSNVPVKSGTAVSPNSMYYFDLCDEPMNLYRDGGVIRVSTTDGLYVDKARQMDLDILQNMKFSKPSIKNLKYTRVKSRIYIQGLSPDTVGLAQFTVAYVPKIQVLDNYAEDDPIYVSEEILPQLVDMIYDIGYKQTYQGSQDVANDGIQQDVNPQDNN